MTVICWDGETLAADKRSINAGLVSKVTKIRRINGCLVGSAGDFSPIQAMFNWFAKGADTEKLPDCQKDKDRFAILLVITPEKKIMRYEQDGFPYEIEEDKYAIGCGRDYAIAAMAMGADAVKAVEIASRFDAGCGDGVDTLSFTPSAQ